MKDEKNSAGKDGRSNKRPRISTPKSSTDKPKATRRIGGKSLDSRGDHKEGGYSKTPRFGKSKSDYNRDEKPSFRKGKSDYNRDEKPSFRKGKSDYSRDEKPSFRKGKSDYNRDEKPSFRKGKSDYSRDEKPSFHRGKSDYNRDEKPSFRKGKSDYNRDEKPSFRRGKSDYNRDEKPAFRKSDSYKGKREYGSGEDRGNKGFFRKSDDDRRSGSYGNKSSYDKKGSYRKYDDEGGKSYGDRRFNKRDDDRRYDKRDDDNKSRFSKSFGQRQGRIKEAPVYEVLKKAPAPVKESKEGVRLNRYLANAGISSRREADDLIVNGQVKINGKVVTEMGVRVMPGDEVRFNNKVVAREKKVYVLLNKPKDFITTMDDPEGRRTVMELVDSACDERIYPVGRLDRMTTGLLLLTNDGELTEKLTHPSFNIRKIYQAELDRPITKADFDTLSEGITLDDGPVPIDDLAIVSEDKMTLGIEIHVGRNRIVRRLFEHLGYQVEKLDRVVYAGLTKKDLPRGKWRYLSEKEVGRLVKPNKRSKKKATQKEEEA